MVATAVSAVVALLLSEAPAAQAQAPSPRELVQAYFVAGDLKRASDFAKLCVKREGARCRPLLVAVVEYQALASRRDELSAKEAAQYVKYDRVVSPQRQGKLTEAVYARFVTQATERAQLLFDGGESAKADQLLSQVLVVDPGFQPAQGLAQRLGHPPSRDGGSPADAGR